MEEVCDFIREYINGNCLEQKVRYIPMINMVESFSTIEEEVEYIQQHVNTIQEIVAITNVNHDSEFYVYCVDLIIANHIIVSVSIGTDLDSRSNDYWVVELEAKILYG